MLSDVSLGRVAKSNAEGRTWGGQSGDMPGIERKRGLQPAVLGHLRGIRGSLLAARPETCPRNVILGRPALFAGLTYPGLLPNGLGHGSTALHISAKRGRAGSVPKPRRLEFDFRQMATGAGILKLPPLVSGGSLPKSPVVSRPSQPPCDTRHEEAPAA